MRIIGRIAQREMKTLIERKSDTFAKKGKRETYKTRQCERRSRKVKSGTGERKKFKNIRGKSQDTICRLLS